MPLRLILRNILAHPVRAFLTFASIVVAVFLLCFLRSGVDGLTKTLAASASNRLWVQSAVSLYVDLPQAYESKIASVPGVAWVCKWQWFGGNYADGEGFFAQFAVDPDTFLPSYPEVKVVEGTYEAFKQNRTGCLIGSDLVATYGWQVGDRVPIMGTIFPKADGSAWEFTVEGIYDSDKPTIDNKTLFFHWEYLRQSLETGAGLGPPGVGVYMVQVEPGEDPVPVMAGIDELFENGPQRVQATTEAEFNRQFISMLGNVPVLLSSIGGAVLFAIFFAVLNTMLMAARERMRDVGVLKALGFSDGAIFRAFTLESLLLCGLGGVAGVLLAKLMEPAMVRALAGQLPGFAIDGSTILFGLLLAFGVGLVAGVGPAWRSSRYLPVEALRGEA